MKIALACDHAGFDHKEKTKEYLESLNYNITDFGCHSDESVDYPDLAHLVAEDVKNKKATLGIVICGSGNGVAMTANKHSDIRAAICWSKEMASLAREHNDSNIISIPARFVSIEETKQIIEVFLKTSFEGGRHKRRTDKINIK